jgi:hypothetical protein
MMELIDGVIAGMIGGFIAWAGAQFFAGDLERLSRRARRDYGDITQCAK